MKIEARIHFEDLYLNKAFFNLSYRNFFFFFERIFLLNKYLVAITYRSNIAFVFFARFELHHLLLISIPKRGKKSKIEKY
jgi:hypothetical protein